MERTSIGGIGRAGGVVCIRQKQLCVVVKTCVVLEHAEAEMRYGSFGEAGSLRFKYSDSTEVSKCGNFCIGL